MPDKFDKNNNIYTKDELLSLGIYELRELGRDIGVQSPTTLKKEVLVDSILSIIYGSEPVRKIGKGRGRPSRSGAKPCKLFIDLIDKIEAPVNATTFITDSGKKMPTSFAFSDLLSSKVASPKAEYVNDKLNSDEVLTLKQGVVCIEEDRAVVRKYRFVSADSQHILPDELILDYALRDNDVIDYLCDDKGIKVSQIFKVNGQLCSRIDNAAKKASSLDNVEVIKVAPALEIESGTSNIIYASSSTERTSLLEDIVRLFELSDFNIVNVCFDRNSSLKEVQNSIKRADFYATTIGDEYETVAMAETALDRAKFFDMVNGKTLLIIDNLNWLISVIETYPKSIYGNFIAKLAKLPKSAHNGITVVCMASHMPNEQIKTLSDMFDNVCIG